MKRMLLIKLTLSGCGKKDAVLDFKPGLNVISGDSDTGKTYAFQCLDYILGKESIPKQIKEAEGYDTVSLSFSIDDTIYHLSRKIGSKKLSLQVNGANLELDSKHNCKNNKNISNYLLQILSGNPDCISIYAGKTKGYRTLSFRDLMHLCTIDETKIIGETSTFSSIQYTEKTASASVLKYLITGKDDRNKEEKTNQNPKKHSAEVVAYLEREKREIQHRIEQILNDKVYTLYTQDESLLNYSSTIANARQEIVALNSSISKLNSEIVQCEVQCCKDEAKIIEFEELKQYYQIELKEKVVLETFDDFLLQTPNLACPLCGQKIQPGIMSSDNLKMLYDHLSVEKRNIADKIKGLSDSIIDVQQRLDQERDYLDGLRENRKKLEDEITRHNVAIELHKQVLAKARELDSMNSELRFLKKRLESVAKDIVEYGKTYNKSDIVPQDNTSFYDAYCKMIEEVLEAWGFAEKVNVTFKDNDLDLIVNDKERISSGKGYRAFIMSAMVIGLMRFCFDFDRLHPGFVIIDSPLVSLKERMKDENQEWIDEYMERNMVNDILRTDASRQVIIFENKEIKYDFDYNYIEFNHAGEGRHGFIPNH